MIKSTFKALQQYASDNGFQLVDTDIIGAKYWITDNQNSDAKHHECKNLQQVKQTLKTIIKDRENTNNNIEYQNIHNLKTESVPLVTGKDNNKLEVAETENIIDCLKTVKSNLNWAKKDKDTHKLLIIANNDRVMAVSNNGQDHAIATCALETNQEFITVVPIERSHGFCKVLEVLKKQGKLDDLKYSLEKLSKDELTDLIEKIRLDKSLSLELRELKIKNLSDTKLVVSWIDGTLEFSTLLTELFNISDDLQVIIDQFRSQVVDTSGTEDSQESTEDKEVVTSNQEDNEVIQELTECDRDRDNNQEQDTNLSEVNSIEQDSTPSTKYVYGVGDIPLLSIDAIESGMYIFFNSFIYIVSHVKKVDFINSKASYILTVTSLLNAVNTENILLTGNELLPAWKTQFYSQKTEYSEVIEQSTEQPKPKRKIAKRASELVDNKYSHIKPVDFNKDIIIIKDSGINYEASDLPLPKHQPKANNGVKGNDREKLLKMVVHGCSIEDMMTQFNWSKKTAQNHTTYIRWWGYDLVRQGNLYKLA